MPVARYTVASGGTGRGAVTGSSPHAIITATPASPIHLVVRIALSHVGRFPPHDAKSMDGRWAGASDQWEVPPWDSREPACRTAAPYYRLRLWRTLQAWRPIFGNSCKPPWTTRIVSSGSWAAVG